MMQRNQYLTIGKWTLMAVPVALLTGSLTALFLWLLEVATHTRWQYPWLLYGLPLAGIAIYFLYRLWGANASRGNNLIIDEIHEPGGGVPARMAPLVIITTLITHLFGGSAGREGTAVQAGGSMAQLIARWFKLTAEDTKVILMAGVAAGFGAVFGTPVTGAIFALEVIALGRIRYDALLPCFVASLLADIVCTAWGIHHTHYQISFFRNFDLIILAKVAVAGAAFGFAGYAFTILSHTIQKHTARLGWLAPVLGGCAIILLTFLAGTRDYLGLGAESEMAGGISIINAFMPGGADTWSWAWKILFTAVTIGTGFKGGEVTPLFFIGATLGNTLAMLSGAPVDLFAGLGFIAVFAAATNTPVACTIMGVELFGNGNIVYYAVACFVAYYCSNRSTGIYSAQQRGLLK